MKQKYPDNAVKKIVEDDTNHEYTMLSIESQGKKHPLAGKKIKRKMTLRHNVCDHTYELDIYEFIKGSHIELFGVVVYVYDALFVEGYLFFATLWRVCLIIFI